MTAESVPERTVSRCLPVDSSFAAVKLRVTGVSPPIAPRPNEESRNGL